jgi:hypothetical protein
VDRSLHSWRNAASFRHQSICVISDADDTAAIAARNGSRTSLSGQFAVRPCAVHVKRGAYGRGARRASF